jgi:hypothetical protein
MIRTIFHDFRQTWPAMRGSNPSYMLLSETGIHRRKVRSPVQVWNILTFKEFDRKDIYVNLQTVWKDVCQGIDATSRIDQALKEQLGDLSSSSPTSGVITKRDPQCRFM